MSLLVLWLDQICVLTISYVLYIDSSCCRNSIMQCSSDSCFSVYLHFEFALLQICAICHVSVLSLLLLNHLHGPKSECLYSMRTPVENVLPA